MKISGFGFLFKVFLGALALGLILDYLEMLPGIIKYHKLKRAGIIDTDNMTGREFEIWLKALFDRLGYKVKLTKSSQDRGADLVVTNHQGVKMAIQAKKLAKGKVGARAIGEALRGKNYYGCDKAIVVTNQTFTKQAFEEAKVNDVELWGRDWLLKEVEKIQRIEKRLKGKS